MSDNFEPDPSDIAKRLGQARAREAQLWGNRIASADVTPGMVQHTESPSSRCICDVCAGTRQSPRVPDSPRLKVLVNRHKHHRVLFADTSERPELEHRGPEPRKPVRANAPKSAPPGTYSGNFGSKLWGG